MVKHIPIVTFCRIKLLKQIIVLLLYSSETWKGSWSTRL